MKYSPEELRSMAKTLIRAKHLGDPRYVEFVMRVTLLTGKTTLQVEYIIKKMAI